MPDESVADTRSAELVATAREVHHKFEFYLVALTFTAGGFAMQSGRFTGRGYIDFLEATSWLLYLLSGMFGLSRLEYFPVFYNALEKIETKRDRLVRFSHSPEAPKWGAQLKKNESLFKNKEVWNLRKYIIQKILLVLATTTLLLARLLSQIYQNYYFW